MFMFDFFLFEEEKRLLGGSLKVLVLDEEERVLFFEGLELGGEEGFGFFGAKADDALLEDGLVIGLVFEMDLDLGLEEGSVGWCVFERGWGREEQDFGVEREMLGLF